MVDDYFDASPLLATVLEQFAAKIRNSLLSPSDTLAVVTYIRMVGFKLSQKQSNVRLAEVIASRIFATMETQSSSATHPSMHAAVEREIKILAACSKGLAATRLQDFEATGSTLAITEFLNQVERTPIR